MGLALVVLVACIAGAAEVLPLSAEAHRQMLELVLAPAAALRLRELDPGPLVGLGVAVGLAVAARRTLADDGRALAGTAAPARRSAWALSLAVVLGATLTALAGAEGSRWGGWRVAWSRSPYATGLGLLTDGILVMAAARAPAGRRDVLEWSGGVALGLGVAAASLPGVSRVAVALALGLWLGLRARRALETAWICALAGQIGAVIAALLAERPVVAPGTVVLAAVVASVAAVAASRLLAAMLARRRLTPLAAWLLTLGVASIAYARALPA